MSILKVQGAKHSVKSTHHVCRDICRIIILFMTQNYISWCTQVIKNFGCNVVITVACNLSHSKSAYCLCIATLDH